MADNKLYEILGVNRNASDGEIKKVIIAIIVWMISGKDGQQLVNHWIEIHRTVRW